MRQRIGSILSVLLVLLATSLAFVVSTRKLEVSEVLLAITTSIATIGLAFGVYFGNRSARRSIGRRSAHHKAERVDEDENPGSDKGDISP
jgi:hypothetical protein